MASRDNLTRDVLFFLKNDLSSNITDPLAGAGVRQGGSSFVMTSYPQKTVNYPIITIKKVNQDEVRAGMQTVAMDITLVIEIRIWARNEKEKDELNDQVTERLRDIQFTSGGSVENDFHDFNILSAVEVDEEGQRGIKSRIIQLQYKFFNQT